MIRIYFFATILCCVVVLPVTAAARTSGWNVNRSSLDTDVVESFPVPVLFGVDYRTLVPDFADPRDSGARSHEGQDMRAPKGTPIVSPTEAIVIRTGTGDSSGKYVYTANPGGETFRYMHLDTIADISSGDKLAPGGYIGTVGDTGNAPDGVYHLHFETRDDNNDAQDPFPRLTDVFTLKEKIAFLDEIFADRTTDDADYAAFLVATFPDVFRAAVAANLDLPRAVERELESSGTTAVVQKLATLEALFKTLPAALGRDLGLGDDGPEVVLLQLFLMYMTDGSARNQLLAAGATGYYGNITAAAVAAYQATYNLSETGVYDTATRNSMRTNTTLHLHIAQ